MTETLPQIQDIINEVLNKQGFITKEQIDSFNRAENEKIASLQKKSDDTKKKFFILAGVSVICFAGIFYLLNKKK